MGTAREPFKLLISIILLWAVVVRGATAERHHLHWTIKNKNITRACSTVSVATINGQFPGPTIEIDEGDTVIIELTSMIEYPVSIHWHGIFQKKTNWADGPAHITQCPLQHGQNYTYEFTVRGQRGTFFWHAHIDWLRETLHGAIIVHPQKEPPYGKVAEKFTILLGDWWSRDPNKVELGIVDTTTPDVNATLTTTINGQPGPFFNCSKNIWLFVTRCHDLQNKTGKTYLLRLVNVALNPDFYFKVANHSMTVVAADGNYLKPFSMDYVVVAPGQTYDVLLTANRSSGQYYFGISPGRPRSNQPDEPAVGIFQYGRYNPSATPSLPSFPGVFHSDLIDAFNAKLRGYEEYDLPHTMDHEIEYITAIATTDCNARESCTTKSVGSIQNATWDDPENTSILEAYYYNVSGVYTTDLADKPPYYADYINSNQTAYDVSYRGRKLKMLKFNETVQVVLQDALVGNFIDSHPFHLHGHDFYVVGYNYSTYNPQTDPQQWNLVDPPKFNTYTIPDHGYVAIRFRANNPGAWLFHCHYDVHKSWGMSTVFITENGVESDEKLPGPTHPLPTCTLPKRR